jgi:DNA-binding winged helix-turn-helix (wHTH) protein
VIFCFADFEFDDERFELRRGGRVIKAEAVALRLLAALVDRPGEVVSKDELIDEVWEGRAVADNVITVAMARLRKALSGGPPSREHVLTVYGRGYRFVGPYTTREAPAQLSMVGGKLERNAPFVGRERVIERLERALAEAYAGRGRLCVLMGEAGIGKTRVVEALEQKLANTQLRVAWGFCREVGDTPPLWPWLRLLREVHAATRMPGAALSNALAELNEVLRPIAEPAPTQDSPASEMTLPNATRHRSFDMFAEAFAQASETNPWLLVLDDLQRADAGSLELLSYLIEEVAHRRILIVATLRHEPGRRSPRPDTHLPYVVGHRNCERIALGRLREADVAAYVAALIDDSDGQLARAVFNKSEGNPFYMTELARQLASMERPDANAVVVPNVALELIRQRVSKLAPHARQVLAAAAVIGRTFESSLLQTVAELRGNELMASLDEAIAADLVVAAPESTTAFAFGHDLMRAALYDDLSSAEQRSWHMRTAHALEQRLEQGDAVPPSELAYHLHAALPESDLRKTVAYCRAASAAAAAVYAHSDAVRYLHNALEALTLMEKPSVRLRTSLWFVIAIYSQGQPAGVRAITEVVRLALEQGDASMLSRAAIMLNPYPGMKPLPGARAALEQAQRALGEEQHGLRAVALAGLACTAPDAYDRARSEGLASEALSLAESSRSRAARYVALVSKLHVRGGPPYVDGGDEAADALTTLHGPNPPLRMSVAPLYVAMHRAVSSLSRGELESTRASIESGLNHARTIRHFLAWHFRRCQALLDINTGALAKGIPVLVMLQRDAEQQRFVWTEPFCAFDRIVIFPQVVEEVQVLGDTIRSPLDYDPGDPPSVWSMKVRALASAGLRDEARAALGNIAPKELASLPFDRQYLGTLGHLAHAAAQLEELDYAEALIPLLARFPDHFAIHFTFLSDAVPELLALLYSALGRHSEAVVQARAAVAMNDRVGFVRSAAEARVQLASALLAQGGAEQRAAAPALCREAQQLAARHGLRLLARKATELLSRSGMA